MILNRHTQKHQPFIFSKQISNKSVEKRRSADVHNILLRFNAINNLISRVFIN